MSRVNIYTEWRSVLIYLFPVKVHDRKTSNKVFLKVDHSFVIKSTAALDLGLDFPPPSNVEEERLNS